ncbi:hypothetical protein [Croceimicrobium sp.]|uniref:hypothetical protein n=1 Tax=Croceimicrobium sp. TaxID=2828340 RepID=UPI003BAB0143
MPRTLVLALILNQMKLFHLIHIQSLYLILIFLMGPQVIFGQPYLASLKQLVQDIPQAENGLAAQIATALKTLHPEGDAKVQLAHNSVYYLQGEEAQIAALLLDDQGYSLIGIQFQQEAGMWQPIAMDIAPIEVAYDSIRYYLRGLRSVMHSAEEAYFTIKGSSCDCPKTSTLDQLAFIFGDNECLNAKVHIPWTWKSLIVTGESRWDNRFVCHIREPGSIEDWTLAKPELIRQLVLLEYAVAGLGQTNVLEQNYMQRSGPFGLVVLNKVYGGPALKNEWRLHLNFEYFDTWTLSWSLERHIGETVKERFSPELDLATNLECLAGDCQNGIGKAQYQNPPRIYSGPFQNGLPSGLGQIKLNGETLIQGRFQSGRLIDSAYIAGNDRNICIYAPQSKAQWVKNLPIPQLGVWYSGAVNVNLEPRGKGILFNTNIYASVVMDEEGIASMDSAQIDVGEAYYYGGLNQKLQPHGKGQLILKDGSKRIKYYSENGVPVYSAVNIFWKDSVYNGPVLSNFIPHGYGVMQKGGETIRGDWYYGRYVGNSEQFLKRQREAYAKKERQQIIEHIRKEHGLDLRSKQMYAGLAKPEIVARPNHGLHLESHMVIWNMSQDDIEVEITYKRPGLLSDRRSTISIPTVSKGKPYVVIKTEFFSFDAQVFRFKTISGSLSDLYVVIQ